MQVLGSVKIHVKSRGGHLERVDEVPIICHVYFCWRPVCFCVFFFQMFVVVVCGFVCRQVHLVAS